MVRKAKGAKGRQLPLIPQPADTEVDAYEFIRRQLRDVGWLVKDPSRNTDGQVWTQNQCLSHPCIKLAFGLKRPENVVKLSENQVWVIEAKASRSLLDTAIEEATGFYCKKINDTPHQADSVEAIIATGVAGNEASGYLARTMVRLNDRWRVVTINGQEATGFLSPNDVRTLLESGGSDIHEYTPPLWLFSNAAERINEILHGGGINKNDRAKTMAALLLAVIDEPPNLETKLPVLIAEINARSEQKLTENNKPDFAPFVKILPPTNKTNHIKFKNALVRTIQELQNLNIRSAMNSSTDVLGQFYEVFLKYGNGAKEIGIVLTPRHITRFAVEALGVGPRDVVLDLACGTGGFLVAAFDYVRQNCSKAQLERFKERNLFGIEQESYVAVLAVVNMIFRGDGRHNITEGNCFTTWLTERTVDGYPSAAFIAKPPPPGREPVTRVLMNPPFALPGTEDREYLFVTQALSIMADGGLLFALLPLDQLFGNRDEKTWRQDDLLRQHTLMSVITMPNELFYPAAQKQVAGIIVKKGVPQPHDQPVFWARVERDGHLKLKSRRLPATELRPPRQEIDQIPLILPSLKNFLANPRSVSVNTPKLCKTAPIDFDDPLMELLPEAYLDTEEPSPADLSSAVESMVRETAAFLVRFGRESRAKGYNDASN